MKDKKDRFIDELEKVITLVKDQKELHNVVFLCSGTWWCYVNSYKGIKIEYSSLVPKGYIAITPSPYF